MCTVAMNIARRRHRRRVMADRPQSPSENTAYLVRDDATTATTTPPALGGIRWTGTGYLSIADSTVHTSTDGHTFRTLKNPLG